MAKVTYKGTSKRGDESSFVTIDGVTLHKGQETEVSDELLAEIQSDSDRLKGYKFDTAQTENKE